MKAILSRIPGGPENLVYQSHPETDPDEGEVRIAVRAVGVNFSDFLVIEDKYQFQPDRPFSPGGEVAGVVDANGPCVTDFAVGDRVIGMAL